MDDKVHIRLTTLVGPIGTGVHLLRPIADAPREKAADVWATFLFLPVLPLGTWVLERGDEQEPTWVVRSMGRPDPVGMVATFLGFYAVAVLAFVPGFVAVAYFVENLLLSLAGLFATLGFIIGFLACLDSTRSRVPLRDAVRSVMGYQRSRSS